MDKPRLKLKEQQLAPVQARIGARFSPPKPVSVFQRLAGALKRLCGWLIFLAVALAAVFLLVAFFAGAAVFLAAVFLVTAFLVAAVFFVIVRPNRGASSSGRRSLWTLASAPWRRSPR